MEDKSTVDTLLISYHKISKLLFIGRKNAGSFVDIINTFADEEAEELYQKLLEKQNKIGGKDEEGINN